MRKVLKNVVKSIALVCLVLEFVSTVYLGIYNFTINKLYENNEAEIVQRLTEIGKGAREEYYSVSENEGDKKLGMIMAGVAMYARFESSATILIFSIMIGSVVGIAMSVDEKSRKKVIVTYISMYIVVLLMLGLYSMLTYGGIDIQFLLGISVEAFVIYTAVYALTILLRRRANNKKIKIMNMEL